MSHATVSPTLRGSRGFARFVLIAGVALLASAAQLRANNAALTVASPMKVGRETRESTKASPSSTLDARTARVAAATLAAQIPGGVVTTVMATGSMRPTFDEKAFLVMEPAPFDSLQVGDVITYTHPRLKTLIVHRVMEKRSDSVWTKGDYNSRPDDVYVTSKNYRMRVVAIIYAREGSNTLAMADSATSTTQAVAMLN